MPSTSIRRNTFARRCSSLKQASNTIINNQSLELQLASNVLATSLTAPPSTTSGNIGASSASQSTFNNESPKKPKWEVIEHFRTNVKGHESISSSLIAAGITTFNLDDSSSNYSGTPIRSVLSNKSFQPISGTGEFYLHFHTYIYLFRFGHFNLFREKRFVPQISCSHNERTFLTVEFYSILSHLMAGLS